MFRYLLLLLSSFICSAQALPANTSNDNTFNNSTYVGSEQCSNCHSEAFKDWQQSHHWHAMEVASEQSVLGDFNNTEFTYNGITSRFYKRDGKFWVTTDNALGKLQEFEITYTFGFEPLQQYLIDFPDGRKQVLSIIWDTRPKIEGGQRWYHLYPEHDSLAHGDAATTTTEQPVDYKDPLHWTGTFFNWNSRCASCHSTDLNKNYDPETNTYNTSWFEINVGCESCHGKGSNHLKWANDKSEHNDNKGWANNLSDQGIWAAVKKLSNQNKVDKIPAAEPHQEYYPTLKRIGPRADQQQQVCASCHSRRSELQQADVEKNYHDTHKLRLLETPLYYPDGQIRDEVYVYGSFLQSKMHAQGVTCSNCHNPHSLKLKAGTPKNSNAVCTQCHSTDIFDNQRHHHHREESTGAQCVNCHMPNTIYMGVDPRRDHSLRIPNPKTSEITGSPNACTQCHDNKSNAWASSAIDSWLKGRTNNQRANSVATTFAAIDALDAKAAPELMKIAQNPQLPNLVRATAILKHDGFYRHEDIENLKRLLQDPSPLVRAGAVHSTQSMPADMRYGLLTALLDEKVMSVRIDIARNLADIPLDEIPKVEANLIQSLHQDFINSSKFNADLPETQVMLGLFYIGRKDYSLAEKAYQNALLLAPKYEGALLNLADLYRGMGRDNDAEPLLKRAIASTPESANSHYALGLLYIRQQKIAQASSQLLKASQLQYNNASYAYTYALILEKEQKYSNAINYLQQWQKSNNNNAQLNQVLKSLQEKYKNL